MTVAFVVGTAAGVGALTVRVAWGQARRHALAARLTNHVLVGRGSSPGRAQRRTSWSEAPAWLAVQLDELEVPVRIDVAWRWWRALAVGALTAGGLVGGVVVALIGAALVVGAPMAVAAVLRG
nr:hypothetical protein [Actinomycetota bacterium]